MDTIRLLLAHSDRRVSNQVEVAVLDVCYDQAVVQSTRIVRLDEFVRKGSVWDFDLIIVGAEHLFADRSQQAGAALEQVAEGIRTIRSQSSAPVIALTTSRQTHEVLLAAGAQAVLTFPFTSDALKAEVRPLLDLNSPAEAGQSSRWAAFGSFFKGLQKA